ncbi:MAG: 50S ribosomal protein L16 [Planctomycetota bacterium]|jgi:large subunit ribosomal protein L16|nr:50S ribosomal protein L16 [Planctomycetota bacterium]
MPRQVKHRKMQKRRIRGKATTNNTVAFGDYGIQSLETGRVTSQQIEAARVAANRLLGRSGKIFIRIFPQRSATAQPAETRMGKGKGDIEYWYAEVKPGTVMFEIAGVDKVLAQQAFRRQAYKLPVKTCMTERRHTV